MDLCNRLAGNTNSLSAAGNLAQPTSVDWYKFTLQFDLIQAIGGVNGGAKTFATMFDIDYADGLARADTTISVFDSTGKLILVSRDSNVTSDHPGPGHGSGLTDLSRGSAGQLDPFIGSQQLPAASPSGDPGSFTYFVAVSSNSQLPTALNAQFNSNSGNTLVRLAPVDSVKRIVEDHIGFTGFKT